MRPSAARSETATAPRRWRTCWSTCSAATWSDPNLIGQDSDDGRAHRTAIAEFLTTNDAENISLGIELDVRYGDSPIVCATDGEAPLWDRRTFVPTVRPGHRGAECRCW